MDWEVVWSETAIQQVEEAVRYVAQSSTRAAEELHANFFDSTEVLSRFPRIGALWEGDQVQETREIACSRYRIFYRVSDADNRVHILLVWHSSRREPRLSSE